MMQQPQQQQQQQIKKSNNKGNKQTERIEQRKIPTIEYSKLSGFTNKKTMTFFLC